VGAGCSSNSKVDCQDSITALSSAYLVNRPDITGLVLAKIRRLPESGEALHRSMAAMRLPLLIRPAVLFRQIALPATPAR